MLKLLHEFQEHAARPAMSMEARTLEPTPPAGEATELSGGVERAWKAMWGLVYVVALVTLLAGMVNVLVGVL